MDAIITGKEIVDAAVETGQGTEPKGVSLFDGKEKLLCVKSSYMRNGFFSMEELELATHKKGIVLRDYEESERIMLKYIVSGSGKARKSSWSADVPFSTGDSTLFVSGKSRSSCIFPKSAAYHHIFITFDPVYLAALQEDLSNEYLGGLLETYEKGDAELVNGGKISNRVIAMLHDLKNSPFANGTAAHTLYTQSKVSELLIEHVQSRPGGNAVTRFEFSPSERRRVHEIKEFLDENFKTLHSTESLSTQVGINPQKLKAIFKHINNKGLFEYQQDVRLSYAYEMLQNGGQVNAIAYELGYSQPSHFIHAFKKRFGYTPGSVIS